jgi:hypothetical protein
VPCGPLGTVRRVTARGCWGAPAGVRVASRGTLVLADCVLQGPPCGAEWTVEAGGILEVTGAAGLLQGIAIVVHAGGTLRVAGGAVLEDTHVCVRGGGVLEATHCVWRTRPEAPGLVVAGVGAVVRYACVVDALGAGTGRPFVQPTAGSGPRAGGPICMCLPVLGGGGGGGGGAGVGVGSSGTWQEDASEGPYGGRTTMRLSCTGGQVLARVSWP